MSDIWYEFRGEKEAETLESVARVVREKGFCRMELSNVDLQTGELEEQNRRMRSTLRELHRTFDYGPGANTSHAKHILPWIEEALGCDASLRVGSSSVRQTGGAGGASGFTAATGFAGGAGGSMGPAQSATGSNGQPGAIGGAGGASHEWRGPSHDGETGPA